MTEATEGVMKPKTTRTAATKSGYVTPHIHTAVHEILGSLAVDKNGMLPSSMGSKPYIAAVDVAAEIKRHFAEKGVISLPEEREVRKEVINEVISTTETGEGSKKTAFHKTQTKITVSIEARYTLISTVDGSQVVIQGVGDGVAQGSAVASNIASTNAFKNAFLRAFLITEQSVEEYAKTGPAEVQEPRAVAAQRKGSSPSAPAVSSDVAKINALKKELTAFAPSGESAPKWLSSQAEAHLPPKDDGTWDGWDRNVNALTALRDALKAGA